MPQSTDGRSLATATDRPAAWSLRTVLLIVLFVAVIPRLFAIASFPLVITNDAQEYLRWATMIADGRFSDILFRADRTPGYSLFLAGAIELLGRNAVAVLVAQHVLGCIAALAVAACAFALSGPRAALVAGILAAIDPWMFALESFALTEVLATTLACLTAALVLNARPASLLSAIGLALLAGALLLVRPAFQVFVPFCVIAWLCRPAFGERVSPPRPWRRWSSLALVIVILAAMLAPWVRVHHAQHGQWRLASGVGAHLWAGLARTNSLSQDYPLNAEIEAAYAPYRGRALSESDFWTVFVKVDGMGHSESALRSWALASIRENPRKYAREAWNATLCQLNRGPVANQQSELDWILERLCAPGTGAQFDGAPDQVQEFVRTAADSPMSRLMRNWGAAQNPGIPQIPLAIAALLLIVAAAVRRRWRAVLLFGATIVFVLFHAALLMPNGRYSLPMWMIWYAALAGLPGFIFRAPTRQPSTDTGTDPASPDRAPA